ncbi:unnamed protein product [Amoebophrya sp. A120]|nr:unnamed protein product [Amoebophrya sp. A120]|eukprot:GSA120T00022548001.1
MSVRSQEGPPNGVGDGSREDDEGHESEDPDSCQEHTEDDPEAESRYLQLYIKIPDVEPELQEKYAAPFNAGSRAETAWQELYDDASEELDRLLGEESGLESIYKGTRRAPEVVEAFTKDEKGRDFLAAALRRRPAALYLGEKVKATVHALPLDFDALEPLRRCGYAADDSESAVSTLERAVLRGSSSSSSSLSRDAGAFPEDDGGREALGCLARAAEEQLQAFREALEQCAQQFGAPGATDFLPSFAAKMEERVLEMQEEIAIHESRTKHALSQVPKVEPPPGDAGRTSSSKLAPRGGREQSDDEVEKRAARSEQQTGRDEERKTTKNITVSAPIAAPATRGTSISNANKPTTSTSKQAALPESSPANRLNSGLPLAGSSTSGTILAGASSTRPMKRHQALGESGSGAEMIAVDEFDAPASKTKKSRRVDGQEDKDPLPKELSTKLPEDENRATSALSSTVLEKKKKDAEKEKQASSRSSAATRTGPHDHALDRPTGATSNSRGGDHDDKPPPRRPAALSNDCKSKVEEVLMLSSNEARERCAKHAVEIVFGERTEICMARLLKHEFSSSKPKEGAKQVQQPPRVHSYLLQRARAMVHQELRARNGGPPTDSAPAAALDPKAYAERVRNAGSFEKKAAQWKLVYDSLCSLDSPEAGASRRSTTKAKPLGLQGAGDQSTNKAGG